MKYKLQNYIKSIYSYTVTVTKWLVTVVSIPRGKGVIYTTPQPGSNYYLIKWIAEEKKFVRKSLITDSLDDSINMGENEMLSILTKINKS